MTINNILGLIFLAFSISPLLLAAQPAPKSRYYHLLTGTYTSGKSEGIYVYRFDTETGELSHVHTAKGIDNPSFVTLSPDGRYAYAVNEQSDGMVSAFRFNQSTGALELLNRQPSGGADPCYLTVDEQSRHVFVGNYSGGSLSVLPILEDGRLGDPVQTIQHKGSSVNEDRQEKAHVHSTVLSHDEQYLFVGDLGTDKIYVYNYRPNATLPLEAASPSFSEISPGSGPRHLLFDASGHYAYVVLELTAEVDVFRHRDGKLEKIQTVPMTADDFEGEVSGAEVRISPDGRFLYASNRGDANEIVAWSIDQQNGTLSFIERYSSGGETPRNFIIDPSGRYLLAANQDSDSIVVFERDQQKGTLRPTGQKTEVGKPVYLYMEPVKN